MWSYKEFINENIKNTPEFKKWFSGSKIINENGDPLIVYHSTNKEFDTFKLKGLSKGFFFSTSSDVNMFPRLFDKERPYSNNASIVPVYLSIKNPKIIDYYSSDPYFENIEIFAAKKDGYDGLIINQDNDIKTIVAFSNKQIKSIYI